MEFRTVIDIPKADFEIAPCEEMLFVGSCFADAIGQRFREEGFPVTVNPYGTMYNPVSVLHTIARYTGHPRTVFLTLGTNHVYRLKATGEIVDNCAKRPQSLFQEEVLSVAECETALQQAVDLLRQRNPEVRVVLTVSPIRYRKYGYHESQLSKATLLLAVDHLLKAEMSTLNPQPSPLNLHPSTHYFPSYEIMMDELRDYRFYAADMLHPSQQAVEYIWERLVDSCFSAEAKAYLEEWRPLKQALSHKPFHPDSADYQAFMDKTMLKVDAIRKKYPTFAL
ncbi:MAG: GSCFA domain-containing protein [Prevotella sp.]|nr:GSCFA domain-containing protein [Prevotella sp.]